MGIMGVAVTKGNDTPTRPYQGAWLTLYPSRGGCLDQVANGSQQECRKMDYKKIELIDVPKPHNHIVEIAKVKQIAAKELQIGDLILFGFHLLLIEDLQLVKNSEMFRMTSHNLATDQKGSIGYPVNSIFHRVIECEITEMEQDKVTSFYTWKRMRRPILGEMQMCGICQGNCGAITQEDIERFDTELKNGIDVCGALPKCYEPTRDWFLSYDGCEEPRHD